MIFSEGGFNKLAKDLNTIKVCALLFKQPLSSELIGKCLNTVKGYIAFTDDIYIFS